MIKRTLNSLTDIGYTDADAEGVDWYCLGRSYIFSEKFIEKYSYVDKMWCTLSLYQILSEVFMEKYSDKLNWLSLSGKQKMSEPFIEKHADKVNWEKISFCQKLSEDFIVKHKNEVDWTFISCGQKLSEKFISCYKKKVTWTLISRFQKLSEQFIWDNRDLVDWEEIFTYQKISREFIEEHYEWLCEEYAKRKGLNIPNPQPTSYIENAFNKEVDFLLNDTWALKSESEKKQAVIDTKLYDCYEDYFIAYKGIRSDRYSQFNFQYRYMPDETYTSWADFTSNENSFGLSAWTYEMAELYAGVFGKVVKVKVYYKDVARVVHGGGKIRATKITILD